MYLQYIHVLSKLAGIWPHLGFPIEQDLARESVRSLARAIHFARKTCELNARLFSMPDYPVRSSSTVPASLPPFLIFREPKPHVGNGSRAEVMLDQRSRARCLISNVGLSQGKGPLPWSRLPPPTMPPLSKRSSYAVQRLMYVMKRKKDSKNYDYAFAHTSSSYRCLTYREKFR